jgi:spore germination protein KB
VVIVALVINQSVWKSLTPFLEKGIGPMLHGGIPTTSRWSELAWMAMIVPYIMNKQKFTKAIFGGVVLVNIYFLIIMVPIVAIFGMELTKITVFPTYSLVEMISIGQFFERIDAVVLGIWVFGAFLKISIFYYAAVLGSTQLFGLKEQKTLILPIGLICLILSLLLFPSIVELKEFGKSQMFYDVTFTFGIPLILLHI